MRLILNYVPQPRQLQLHRSRARQTLFGGSAGGGKSRALRWDCIYYCIRNPGLEAYLFRRTYGELEDNHIRPLLRELPQGIATYKSSKSTFDFKNGSKLVLCHAEHLNDYLKYMGAEMHILAVDEAALFEVLQLIELRARVRLGSFSLKIRKEDRLYLPRMILGSNPGGPSHLFLKRTFIDPAPPGELFHDDALINPADPDSKGWTTMFIPARMKDNKYLDKDYGVVFGAMSKERAQALRDGDWDTIEGAALHLLDKKKHWLPKFSPPKWWSTFMSMDWGSSAPYAVGWFTSVGEDLLIPHDGGTYVPKGSIIQFAEMYGWTGKENEGCRKPSSLVAKEILDYEKTLNIRSPDYRMGDSAMWARIDGPSPAENMMTATEGKLILTRCKKDRTANYDEIMCRLAGNPFLREGGVKEEHPTFFITEDCVHTWRTLPTLRLDKLYPDKGPDDLGENHIYDMIVYLLSTRPYAVSKADRDLEEYEAIKRLIRRNVDHYATA